MQAEAERDYVAGRIGIDIVVSTHLHFDHCGGNHVFVGGRRIV